MKKALSLILALVMALSLTVPAFADDNATTVTATVPSMSYNIVIPTSGAAMTEENHATGVILGAGVTDGKTKAGVENVQYAKATDRIFYTATLGDFTDGNGHTMTATYTYAQGGDYAALTGTTKVTVFDGSKEGSAKYADSTVKVSVSNEVWNAAAAGTYTATVTFNFEAEEAEAATVTAADALVTGAQFRLTGNMDESNALVVGTYQKTDTGFSRESLTVNGVDASANNLDTCQLNDDSVIYFKYGMETYLEISIDTNGGIYNGIQGSLSKFEVKPAGATEFTEVTLIPEKTMIANILATAEGGFPTANDDSAWVSDGGAKCWGDYYETEKYTGFGFLNFKRDISSENLDVTKEATLQDGNYVYVKSARTYTFVMENGKLTAITFDNSDEIAVGNPLYSTYTAPTVE